MPMVSLTMAAVTTAALHGWEASDLVMMLMESRRRRTLLKVAMRRAVTGGGQVGRARDGWISSSWL
jgi:hypothetical protein